MRTLPLQFSIRQWTFTQVNRRDHVAIYRQQHKDDPSVIRFEVILVKQYAPRLMPRGITQEAGEYYPGSKQWGSLAWTCFTLTEAEGLAAELRAQKMIDS